MLEKSRELLSGLNDSPVPLDAAGTRQLGRRAGVQVTQELLLEAPGIADAWEEVARVALPRDVTAIRADGQALKRISLLPVSVPWLLILTRVIAPVLILRT